MSRLVHIWPLCCAGFLLMLVSCAWLYPDPNVSEDDFASDPADYAKNAKEYFDAEHYGRARAQLQKFLEKHPDDWMARIHLAFCDYYLGLRSLKTMNLQGGRQFLQRAEAEFRARWNGELHASTWDTYLKQEQPWKAAFGIALVQRALGWADNLEAQQTLQIQSHQKTNDPKRAKLAVKVLALKKRRNNNYAASAALFKRLAAMQGAAPDAIKNLAELDLIQGQDDAAEKQFLRYLALADKTYQENQAKEEKLQETFKLKRNRKVAQRFLKQKLESNSRKRVDVLVQLGLVRFQHDDYKRALTFLRRAQKIDPSRLDTLLKMAQCLGEDGQYARAIEKLNEYIKKSSQQSRDFSEEIAEAYRLRSRYQRKLEAEEHSGSS